MAAVANAAAAPTVKKPTRPKGKLYVWSRGGSRMYAGKPVSMGQVVELAGVQNDHKLVDLGYLKAVGKGEQLAQCLRCGSWFLTEADLHSHEDDNCPAAEVDLPGLEVDQTN
jgi:hypothetical protein